MPSTAGSKVSCSAVPSRTTNTVEVAEMLSSSRPSSPRNTTADTPRSANTPATTGSMRSSNTPIACEVGCAGLVSGPRKLNTVGTPISLRAGATCLSAGW